MNRYVLGGVVVAGLSAGYGTADHILRQPERSDRIITLFQEVCLTPSRPGDDALIAAYGLLPQHLDHASRRWIDPVSESFLSIKGRRCSILTHAPESLSRAEAEEIGNQVDALVASTFPDLPFDPRAVFGDEALFRAWMTGENNAPDRWGIWFYAYPDWGGSAGSNLSFTSPPKPEA